MKYLKIFIYILILSTFIYSQNLPPVIENVLAEQRTDGSKIVDIYYDLSDPNNDEFYEVWMEVSIDEGETWTVTPTSFSSDSDIGIDVTMGTDKHIVWYLGNQDYDLEGYDYKIKIIADEIFYLIDYDGNSYETIQVGGKVWMAENYRCTHNRYGGGWAYNAEPMDWPYNYNGGDYFGLPYSTSCAPLNVSEYGYLYNAHILNDYFAPDGWHIPSPQEWEELIDNGGYVDITLAGTACHNSGSCPFCSNNFKDYGSRAHYWTSQTTWNNNCECIVNRYYRNFDANGYSGTGWYYEGPEVNLMHGKSVRLIKDY